jgi:hypothetical protein
VPERHGQGWPQTPGAVILLDGNGSPRQAASLWLTLLSHVHVWTWQVRGMPAPQSHVEGHSQAGGCPLCRVGVRVHECMGDASLVGRAG